VFKDFRETVNDDMYTEKINGYFVNGIIVFVTLLQTPFKFFVSKEFLFIMYDEIKNSEIPMNIILYSTLIKGYTRVKNFNKAFEIYERMIKDSFVQVNTIAYNAILDCCVECGDMAMLDKIYNDFKCKAENSETYPQPDLITYSTVIKGHGKQKNIDKHKNQCQLKVKTY